ncbi:MAG: poly-beta-1,6-N-acetyl-D-glucosamine biosynthesis protein PgaD [Candidatus Omnitrophica bacterium]|nr:poly-beta-1,6-N-acetyl-D-glucosamine biosynthesis protein PgaD [Candidatus Omnitrophota bacterium]
MHNPQDSKSNDEDLIIYHPHALNPLRRGMEWGMIAIGWFIWAVLCRPLLLALLWFLGFEIFYEHMIRLGGIKALAGFSFIYVGTVFVMYLFIRGWNFYNAKKFKNKNRRKNVRDVSVRDLENYFKFTPGVIQQAQGWKNVAVSFYEKSQILLKESRTAGSNFYKGYFKSG